MGFDFSRLLAKTMETGFYGFPGRNGFYVCFPAKADIQICTTLGKIISPVTYQLIMPKAL